MAKHRDEAGEPGSFGTHRYDEELLSANWNPVIDLLAGSSASDAGHSATRRVSEEDADAFLGRIYSFCA